MLTAGFLDIAVGETINCGGQVATMNLLDDDIVIHTGYVLRNYNSDATITINRIVVYDADENIRCNYPKVDDFPAAFKRSLSPHQSTSIASFAMKTCQNGISPQPGGVIQTIIDWSFSGKSGKPLFVSAALNLLNNTDGYMLLSPFSCGER